MGLSLLDEWVGLALLVDVLKSGVHEVGLLHGFHAFALRDEVGDVLERVLVELEARVLVLSNHRSKAVELSWVWISLVLDGLNVEWEHFLEEGVDLGSVFEFFSQSIEVLNAWVFLNLLVKIVELDVS